MRYLAKAALVLAAMMIFCPLLPAQSGDPGYDGLTSSGDDLETPVVDLSNIDASRFDATAVFRSLGRLTIDRNGSVSTVTLRQVLSLLDALERGNGTVEVNGVQVPVQNELSRQTAWWKAAMDRCLMVGADGGASAVGTEAFVESRKFGVDSPSFDAMFDSVLADDENARNVVYEHVVLIAGAYERMADGFLRDQVADDLASASDASVAYGAGMYQGNRARVVAVQLAVLRKFFPRG